MILDLFLDYFEWRSKHVERIKRAGQEWRYLVFDLHWFVFKISLPVK